MGIQAEAVMAAVISFSHSLESARQAMFRQTSARRRPQSVLAVCSGQTRLSFYVLQYRIMSPYDEPAFPKHGFVGSKDTSIPRLP